ncbi:DUF3298 and DUF4163 domain-containing protein [Peribacillus huizhouensis]|uniref:Anti-sigma factor n=1 Tax=Peribacillus huizhouensis TaxID=1501239 RepID=A0ABR6CM98_9BACI|nr:DUF3298 and DUF4163 domain-containing protein [Peribacillus huizhouensis]MBA9026161.1 hypothetical protein [Peribacillus huizhouensis]
MKRMKQLIKEYQNIEIPEELQTVVKQALRQEKKRKPKKIIIGIAVAAILFISSVNTSSTIAYAFSDIPVLGKMVNLITFREYRVNEDTYNANIKVPAVTNLDNKDLEKSLNEKYLKENEKLYQEFLKDMEEVKKSGGGHLGIESGYEIKTDNKQLLSIARYNVNTVGSSSTTMKFDTIDKKNQILINLPSLFEDEDYLDVISENIKEQMKAQMKANPEVSYWVSGIGEEIFDPFEKIVKEQNFYINNQGKLVISFDKYEVSPGFMGVVEFIIPTEVIQDQLVSNEYIK